jgi:hypothetical protein
VPVLPLLAAAVVASFSHCLHCRGWRLFVVCLLSFHNAFVLELTDFAFCAACRPHLARWFWQACYPNQSPPPAAALVRLLSLRRLPLPSLFLHLRVGCFWHPLFRAVSMKSCDSRFCCSALAVRSRLRAGSASAASAAPAQRHAHALVCFKSVPFLSPILCVSCRAGWSTCVYIRSANVRQS